MMPADIMHYALIMLSADGKRAIEKCPSNSTGCIESVWEGCLVLAACNQQIMNDIMMIIYN